ncbi:GNAT family N-acetyltransferase [Kitasatospora aureofaciens]|uniref:N-acetyltransferase n=1 Tax=Kitasatospora aureofaciens TaxID=1894 RepID=A0A1E7NC44_KITAU|nr:GNAT family N-acetyltransferase [Kitasatospora aureofaciens]QEV01477.1 GNAT family N-acetyltransferase [Streptomyces viridifaciens]ARF80226.1 GNAT family N-acetyltransferase [Kitasatospora aureofaciens]OEV38257.1 GNAT family N-acetyltransferase [Kitasatospora aureofaciens]UKZ07879.1 GNAT family N-acetyltransferase [Streptomyces viridifaciens]GGU97789.1 N-acetyltransferase [Kitasatospora aureofaciens]
MSTIIRRVRTDEWERVKEIRLAALQDPVAHLAFLDTYENASAKPDGFWQERTAGAAEGESVWQAVAEAPDGRWLGTMTVLVERPGGNGALGGDVITVPQAHVVGVYVRPEARGTGLAHELIEAAQDWAWSLSEPRLRRVRLFVHESNARAEAMYVRAGFKPSGASVPVPGDETHREIELAVERD